MVGVRVLSGAVLILGGERGRFFDRPGPRGKTLSIIRLRVSAGGRLVRVPIKFEVKTMRRILILSTVLTIGVAVLGACEPKVEPTKPPAATPSPAATASPAVSPTVSPTGSPAASTPTPDAKKGGDTNTNKPAATVNSNKPKA